MCAYIANAKVKKGAKIILAKEKISIAREIKGCQLVLTFILLISKAYGGGKTSESLLVVIAGIHSDDY